MDINIPVDYTTELKEKDWQKFKEKKVWCKEGQQNNRDIFPCFISWVSEFNLSHELLFLWLILQEKQSLSKFQDVVFSSR